EQQGFHYETVFLPQAIYQLNFSVFADLTLWVNYIGMGEHFLALSSNSVSPSHLYTLQDTLTHANLRVENLAEECLQVVREKVDFTEQLVNKVHREASMSVVNISKAITAIYPYTRIKGASQNTALNRVFRDYFTATQHHIFTAKAGARKGKQSACICECVEYNTRPSLAKPHFFSKRRHNFTR
ncbi:MAG: hypothetical protein GY954_15135, partial [Alteromonas sp.]|nr:hypothetical protein [Alteromonas sp.]